MALKFLTQVALPTEAPVVFDSVLELLAEFGFFRVVLPFLLVFAITYGALIKTEILGKDDVAKSVSAIISLAIAFFVISATPVVNALSILIPQASFLLVVVLFILLLVSFIGLSPEDLAGSTWGTYIVVGLIIVIFLGLVDTATGFQIPIVHDIVLVITGAEILDASSETMNFLVLLGAILAIPILVIWYVLSKSK